MKTASDYMRNERPLLVDPQVAAVIGLNEAIILQQVLYWLKKSEHIHEGRRWIYNSYEQWQEQFPFWSTSTIGRVFRKLEEGGIVISQQLQAASYDRTKWYSVDYDTLDLRLKTSGRFDDAILTPSGGADWHALHNTESTSKKKNGAMPLIQEDEVQY